MKKKKCSFILPTKNVEKYIGPLLDSIFFQEYDGEIEVVLLDSSDDRTPEIARQFPIKYVWLDPADYNYGKTRNDGAAMTDGEFLVFLSTDVEITDNKWLSRLTRHFADPQVAGVFGRQVPRESSPPMEQFLIRHTYPAESDVLELENGKLRRRKTPVIYSHVNAVKRRSVWEQIKIPEMLKGDDQQWAKMAMVSGYKIVYDAEAAVYHSHTYSLKGVFREYFDTGASFTVVHHDDVVAYPIKAFIADGMNYVVGEYKFMLRNGYWRWIPYATVYNMMKFLGISLGAQQKHMPLWMKRALCKKKNHWDQYDGVIKEPA